MAILFKKLDSKTVVPYKATQQAAGFDIVSPISVNISPGKNLLVGTGWACAIPLGMVGIISPRSSMAAKKNARIGARIIDSDYRGEVMIDLHNDGDEVLEIRVGDRIAQMLVTFCHNEAETVNELPDPVSNRIGGFGSTGV